MEGGTEPTRSHLARLCRGFLLAREENPRRAQAFLVTFLAELSGPEGPRPPRMR